MKNSIFLIFFSFLLFTNLNTKVIKDSLQSKLIDFTEVLAESETQKLDMENFTYMKEVLTNNPQKLGFGSFGTVFQCSFRTSLDSDIINVAAKQIGIENDYSTTQGKKEQDDLETEIDVFNDIMDADSNATFFPFFYGAYNVTDLIIQIMKEKGERYFENKEQIILMMEKMDMTFFEYDNKLNQDLKDADPMGIFDDVTKFDSLLHTRLTIAENMAKGLITIIENYTHCDIKPSNIMIKQLDAQERQKYKSLGVEELELFPNKFYAVKIIDFGLAVKGSRSSRKCRGGTYEYLPPEAGTSLKNETQDVFAVVMMMLDMENWANRLSSFHTINAIWIRQRTGKTPLSSEDTMKIKMNSAYKILKIIQNDDKYREILHEKIREYFTSVDAYIQKDSSKTLEEVELTEQILRTPMLLKPVLGAALEIYYTLIYPEDEMLRNSEKLDKDAKSIKKKLKKLTGKEPAKSEFLKKDLDFLNNIHLCKQHALSLNQSIIPYYMRQIMMLGDQRDTMEEFLAKILKFKSDYLTMVSGVLPDVLSYRRECYDDDERILKNGVEIKSNDEVKRKEGGLRAPDRALLLV